jgi:hypothetical protein
MTKNCPNRDSPISRGTARYRIVCDLHLIALMLMALARTCDASDSEQIVTRGDLLKPDFNVSQSPAPFSMSTFSLPLDYVAGQMPQIRSFSTHDFRPRGHSVFYKETQDGTFEDAPMLNGTTVWQRMTDYRAHGRVRLLTLWETAGSTVALLAGKKGEPSLQWTSRSMNRGGATRGVLDEVFSTSFAGAARSLQFSPRTSGSEAAAARPVKMLPAAANPSK